MLVLNVTSHILQKFLFDFLNLYVTFLNNLKSGMSIKLFDHNAATKLIDADSLSILRILTSKNFTEISDVIPMSR